MPAAIAFQVTTTPAAAALTGVVVPTSAPAAAQTAGEDFAAALAALLGANVATTQPNVAHAPKTQLANTESKTVPETQIDPNGVVTILPVVPGLILTDTPKRPAQAGPTAQINIQATQTSALQILQAAIKGTPVQAAATASSDEATPASPQPQAQAVAAAAPAAAFAALAANAQQQTQTAPATAKAPVKAAPSKEAGASGEPQLEVSNTNANAPTLESKASSNSHLFGAAIERASSYNANGNSQNGNASSNQNAPQLPTTASPVAIAIHTTSVDTTAATTPTATAQTQVAVPLDALAVHIARKFEGGENRFEIRLDPVELGKLDISLSVDHDGRVQAVVRAERPETLDLLQRDARLLESQLRQSGLNVDSNSLSFSLGGGNNQRSGFASAGQPFADALDAGAEAEAQTPTTTTIVNVRDGVDIRI